VDRKHLREVEARPRQYQGLGLPSNHNSPALHCTVKITPAWLLGGWCLLAQHVQHLDAEEGELTVLDKLTQVSQAGLTSIRDLLQGW